ncbi:helix-turn-helix domain-containing protein [Acinetobacter sp. BY484]|uniref:helix-turn-helix domain-containing protein n=1 Tax=unclassified Acinetobacter TaxID=196816 RepID=UPI001C240743|nr:helix-turn-helix domain-containing protein [Acinetobacter sp. BY484]
MGVSQKVLQLCFHEIMGTSPAQYLKAVRLNRVKRNLKKADPQIKSVQDIACEWGFWHPSNFTANYKAMFGELPSETLMH